MVEDAILRADVDGSGRGDRRRPTAARSGRDEKRPHVKSPESSPFRAHVDSRSSNCRKDRDLMPRLNKPFHDTAPVSSRCEFPRKSSHKVRLTLFGHFRQTADERSEKKSAIDERQKTVTIRVVAALTEDVRSRFQVKDIANGLSTRAARNKPVINSISPEDLKRLRPIGVDLPISRKRPILPVCRRTTSEDSGTDE